MVLSFILTLVVANFLSIQFGESYIYFAFHQKLVVHSPPENVMGFDTESSDRITQGMCIHDSCHRTQR